MHASQALNIIKPNQVEILADLLPIELINSAYELTDTVTLRKRKLILESMLWLLVGMAIYNDKSMADIVNMLDIAYRTGKPFVVPSALPQRRKNLGESAAKALFECTQRHWFAQANLPNWNGEVTLRRWGFMASRRLERHQSTLAYPDEKGLTYEIVDEKGLTYEIVQSLGRKDKLIKLKSNPQARKKWPELEQEVVVRLITRVKDGK